MDTSSAPDIRRRPHRAIGGARRAMIWESKKRFQGGLKGATNRRGRLLTALIAIAHSRYSRVSLLPKPRRINIPCDLDG
jgi:hypothetical protein